MSKLTINALKDITPKSQRSMITQDLVDKLNQWGEDPKLMESYGDNVLSYIGVLKEGKFKITDYMNAVRFVSYKLMGHSDIDAYIITFPERYERLLADGVPREDMSPYVSAYKKNALVVKIFEQTVIPVNVLNNHMAQDSLNELMKIGLHGRSEMARVAALSKVLDKTDAPETKKMQLDIGVNPGEVIGEYEEAMRAMVAQQKALIEQGGDLKAITNAKIKRPEEVIEAEIDGE